jgi:hypothetical protein
MSGYTRQRASQIVNGSLGDADDVAAEFNQVQTAFNAVGGHRHNGTSGEGAPITVLGPTQEFVANSSSFSPKTSATYDLGTTALRYKDAYFTGNVVGATFTGNLTGNVTGNVTGSVTGNASTATTLETPRNINGTAFNGSAAITTANWGTSRDITVGNTTKAVNGSANVSWSLSEIGVNNNTLTLATSGIATGSQTWTANQGTNATFTVSVPATNITYSTAASNGTVNSSTGTGATIPAATTSLAGLLTAADKTKLDGIAAGAQVNVGTNLGSSGTGASRTITSSTGSSTTITYSFGDLGVVLASQAEAQAGTDNTKFMTPLRTAEAITALSPTPAQLTQVQAEDPASTVFGLASGQRMNQAAEAFIRPARFVSAEVTPAQGGTYTFDHGLGRLPHHIAVEMRCETASQGFVPGDVICLSNWHEENAGMTVIKNTTNVRVLIANVSTHLRMITPTANALQTPTLSNFRLRVRAW